LAVGTGAEDLGSQLRVFLDRIERGAQRRPLAANAVTAVVHDSTGL